MKSGLSTTAVSQIKGDDLTPNWNQIETPVWGEAGTVMVDRGPWKFALFLRRAHQLRWELNAATTKPKPNDEAGRDLTQTLYGKQRQGRFDERSTSGNGIL